jgi:hypothetical protein
MNLRGRIPVEPLDEERVVNIERRVVAGYGDAMARGRATSGSRWLLPMLAAGAAAAVVAAVLVWKLRPAPAVAPQVAAVRVEAAPDGSRVELGDATIAVAPGGSFVVTRPDGGVLIALDRGRVDLEVAPRKDRAPLVVRAGDVDVVVVGTKFSVEHAAEIVVTVTEGVVSVQRGGDAARVAAGQRWAAPAQVAAGAPMPPVETIQVAAADRTPDTIASADIEMSGDHGMPELHGHDTVVPKTPVAAKDRDKRPRQGSAGDAAGNGSGSSSVGSGSASVDVITAVRQKSVAPPKDVGVTGEDAVKLYLVYLEEGRAKEERLIGYYGLAHVRKAQGKTAEALRWLDAYITQRPKTGPELESVRWMQIQLLCKHPIDAKCREAANSYIRAFPATERAQLALEISNSID